jgi:mannose-6-phosphate isomerase-like protein (cupin superfamily)
MPVIKRRSFLQSLALLVPSSLFAQSIGALGSSKASQAGPEVPLVPVRSGEDRYSFKRNIPNGESCFKVSSKDCRGDFFAMEHHHTKKGGPPRHLHHGEDEWFYVVDGEYIVEVGGVLHRLKTGDSVLGPRGVPHAFAYIGETTGRFLITYAPAGRMEEFFDSRDRLPGGRSTYVNDADKMRAYGMELTGPPLELHSV